MDQGDKVKEVGRKGNTRCVLARSQPYCVPPATVMHVVHCREGGANGMDEWDC